MRGDYSLLLFAPLPQLYLQAGIFIVLLFAASIADIRCRRIPNFICILIAAAGLISFRPARFWGLLAALPLFIAALYHPAGMGGGDIKLTAASGIVLGLPAGLFGLTAALLSALLYYGVKKLWHWLRHSKNVLAPALPLAPFLSFSFIAAYFLNFEIGGIPL